MADGLGEKGDGGGGNIDAFYAGDAAGVGEDLSGQLLAEVVDELVGKVEDEDCGAPDGVFNGGVGDDVFGQGYGGQVFDVFVEVVDEARELLGLGAELGGGIVVFRVGWNGNSLFVDPHLHFGLE